MTFHIFPGIGKNPQGNKVGEGKAVNGVEVGRERKLEAQSPLEERGEVMSAGATGATK